MNGFLETLRNLGPTKLAVLGIAALLIFGLVIYIATRGGDENLTMLASDLQPEESARIVNQLEASGTSYELRSNGTQIWVPADQRDRLLLDVAGEGLLPNGAVGNELFDESSTLGETNFVQQINRKRALEGELARTIRTLKEVKNVRVHLVLPERELFARETRDASASVVLQLVARTELEPRTVTAIQQLVAAAVPALKPTRISVVDDKGHVYAEGVEDEQTAAIMRATQQRLDYERRLSNSIEAMVGQTVGRSNVRAQVAAEMDFNRETVNEEVFDPDGQVARSVQEVEESAESTETEGQDPVTVATNLPDADTQIATGAGSYSRSNRTEETTNFEISRKVRSFVRETGQVERVSVAVLVNGVYERNPDGSFVRDEQGNRVYQERSETELAAISDIVRNTVGLRDDRGDTITVRSMRFHDEIFFEDEGEDLIFGIPKDDLFKIIELLVLAIVAILVILLVVRPLIARALEVEEEADLEGQQLLADQALAGADMVAKLDETAEMEALEQMIDIEQVNAKVRASSLRKIAEIVDKHPEEAVAILRSWMYQEA